jgi:hypothetical protein
MDDVYLLETLMRERKADAQRRAARDAALRELEQSRPRSGNTLVSRVRRAVTALLPVRRAKTIAFRTGG